MPLSNNDFLLMSGVNPNGSADASGAVGMGATIKGVSAASRTVAGINDSVGFLSNESPEVRGDTGGGASGLDIKSATLGRSKTSVIPNPAGAVFSSP
jgi:hypothetical protein